MTTAQKDKPAKNSVRTGVLWIIGFCLLAPLMDSVAKELGLQQMPVIQVVWGRFFFHILLLTPFLLYIYGRKGLSPPQFWLQTVRGLFLLSATFCFFTGILYAPIATILSLALTYPFVVTAFSPWILGEKIGIRRWGAVLVGFCGTLVIVRPGFADFQFHYLYGLGTGFAYGFYMMITRKLSGAAPPLVILFHTCTVGMILLSLGIFLVVQSGSMGIIAHNLVIWIWPTPMQWGMLVLVGAFATTSHYCMIRALDHAPASVIAPWGYVEIAAASFFGWYFFGNIPDRWTWLGMLIIVSCGIYIAHREAQKKKQDFALTME